MRVESEITAEKLKEWRDQNRYSMAQAARRAGVNRSTWSKWERGIAQPTAANQEHLRTLMTERKNAFISHRTKEVFGPLEDDELRAFLSTATLEESTMGSPITLKVGPMTRDSRMEHLASWFGKYFGYNDLSDRITGDEIDLYFDARYYAAAAGYCVGSFKYSVTDDDAENWYQAAESLFVDLVGMKRLIEQGHPKDGPEIWSAMFEPFHVGYAAAVEQKCWRVSAFYESLVLEEGMGCPTKSIPMVKSVISPEDFGEHQPRLLFQVILDSFDQGKSIDAETVESKLKEICSQGAMDASRSSRPESCGKKLEDGASVRRLFSLCSAPVDSKSLRDWVTELKQRSLSRSFMDACRKVSSSIEEGLDHDMHLDELEKMISRLRSVNKQRETGEDPVRGQDAGLGTQAERSSNEKQNPCC